MSGRIKVGDEVRVKETLSEQDKDSIPKTIERNRTYRVKEKTICAITKTGKPPYDTYSLITLDNGQSIELDLLEKV